MEQPGRKYSAGSSYRYGFNGKENDKDAGKGIQDYGMRIYDVRLGKFLSVDPLTKTYPWYTPYQFAGNKVIWCIDLDGLEDIPATGSNYPQPFSSQQLVNWAKKDGFFTGPKRRGETVLLIQDYRVIESGTNKVVDVHKEIVLFKGEINKPIAVINQGNITLTQSGNATTSSGPEMTTQSIQFGTSQFRNQIDKIYPDGIPVSDVSITFGYNSRKLTNKDQVVQILKPVADYLKAYPDSKINISGNTDLNRPPGSIISSDNEDITIQQLMDGRAKTLTGILTENLKVKPEQISQTPGTQGVDTNANIKIIQPKKEIK